MACRAGRAKSFNGTVRRPPHHQTGMKLVDAVFAPMRNRAVAETFGGGEMGKRAAEALHRIKFDLPLDDMLDMTGAPKRDADKTRPNPT